MGVCALPSRHVSPTGSRTGWTWGPGPPLLSCLRPWWTKGLCLGPSTHLSTPHREHRIPGKAKSWLVFKANLDAPTPSAIGSGQGMGCLLPHSRRETPPHSAPCRGSEIEADLPSPTEIQTCKQTHSHTHRIYADKYEYTQSAHGEPGHGSHTLTATQNDLVLQTSSPTASDNTQKAERGTGIGSHRTTIDSWTSWPTDSQPHTKCTDKSDFTKPTTSYTGLVSHTHTSTFREPLRPKSRFRLYNDTCVHMNSCVNL